MATKKIAEMKTTVSCFKTLKSNTCIFHKQLTHLIVMLKIKPSTDISKIKKLEILVNSIYNIRMSANLVNISLTVAGLVLIVLFYLPMFRHLLKNTKQFFLYLIFWLLSLTLITSVIDYMFFSNSKTEAILKPNAEELEA